MDIVANSTVVKLPSWASMRPGAFRRSGLRGHEPGSGPGPRHDRRSPARVTRRPGGDSGPTAKCMPRRRPLRRALDEGLSEPEWREVAAHLELCEACRSQLDRWTENSLVVTGAPGPGEAELDVSPALDEVLQRLKRQQVPSVTAGAPGRVARGPPGETSGRSAGC